MTAKAKHRPKVRRRDVRWGVSRFTGELKDRVTSAPKLCEMCDFYRATWLHERKDGQPCYLCFGCGGH